MATRRPGNRILPKHCRRPYKQEEAPQGVVPAAFSLCKRGQGLTLAGSPSHTDCQVLLQARDRARE